MSINTNYPVIHKNQPSQGFRDNFSDIELQLGQIRSKNILFVDGDLTGSSQIIGSGAGQILFTAQIRDDPQLSGASNMRIPQGATSQRPGNPLTGMLRFNRTIDAFEGFNNGSWVTLSGTGGVISVEDEGVDLGVAVSVFNFTGTGVVASDGGAGTVDVNITGGGGGGDSVLIVNDITGRDALITTGGEQVLVLNDAITADGVPGEGEWALFLRNQTNTAWLETSTERRGDEEIESISIDFDFDDGAIQNIGVVPVGRRVTKVTVLVSVAWDTASTLIVGTVASPSLLMLANENDLEGIFVYEVLPGLGNFLVNTGLRASYNAVSNPSTGSARVTIAYA